MLTLTKRPTSEHVPASRLRARQAAPVGIDIGSHAIKWAQVVPEAGGWRLTEAHIIPWVGSQSLDHQSLVNGDLRTALRAATIAPPSRTAACTLSMALTELRSLDLPAGSPDELRQMAYNELADGLGEAQLELMLWPTPRADGEAGTISVTALALPTATALAVAEDLLAERLRCRLLTALPYALAKAVTMADPSARATPVAVLDWGGATPSLTVVQHGRPVFTRLLRDCGAARVAEAVSQLLQLSTAEAWGLLGALGDNTLRRSGPDQRSPLADRVVEAARGATKPLLQQLERTRAFLRQQFADLVPQRVWIVGAGALLQPFFPAISTAIGAEVQPWRLPTSQPSVADDPMQAVLAAAIGMSALGGDA
ncbi:MAG: hypothetical protein SH850_12850 [Planctomycetaceae bacterium]|nr:hypothetical protein [Planctomycetaceae bacterium]